MALKTLPWCPQPGYTVDEEPVSYTHLDTKLHRRVITYQIAYGE